MTIAITGHWSAGKMHMHLGVVTHLSADEAPFPLFLHSTLSDSLLWTSELRTNDHERQFSELPVTFGRLDPLPLSIPSSTAIHQPKSS